MMEGETVMSRTNNTPGFQRAVSPAAGGTTRTAPTHSLIAASVRREEEVPMSKRFSSFGRFRIAVNGQRKLFAAAVCVLAGFQTPAAEAVQHGEEKLNTRLVDCNN